MWKLLRKQPLRGYATVLTRVLHTLHTFLTASETVLLALYAWHTVSKFQNQLLLLSR